MDAALLAVIAVDIGRQLATCIAVDTGGIDKKISRDILGQAMLQVGHMRVMDLWAFYFVLWSLVFGLWFRNYKSLLLWKSKTQRVAYREATGSQPSHDPSSTVPRAKRPDATLNKALVRITTEN